MKLKKLIYVSMFATIMGVLGMMPPIFTGISPVPITLQSMGVMLAGSVLGARFGAKYAALSQILFLLLVVAGLPLLSGGRGGIGVLVGPSAGYLTWLCCRGICDWLVCLSIKRRKVLLNSCPLIFLAESSLFIYSVFPFKP